MVDSETPAKESKAASQGGQKGSKRSRDSSFQQGEGNPGKRTRVSRACDQCRASREKCDGIQPICQTCQGLNRICTFLEPARKRGIQPNYIRTLELTLAWLFRNVPGCEKALAERLPSAIDSAQWLLSAKDAAGAESLHQEWRNSVVCRQIEQMLSGTAIEPADSLQLERLQSSPVIELSRESGPYRSSPMLAQSNTAAAGMDLTMQNPNLVDPQITHTQLSSGEMALTKLPDNAWTLLEYYFAYTHSWLPMTEKQVILKTMYSYPPQGVVPENCSTADYAELWSIMALAAFQMSRFSGAKTGNLRESARSFLPNDSSALETGHAKAMLLLALLDMSREDWLSAWLIVGYAVRLVLQGSIGASTSSSRDSQVVRLSAFIIETAVAKHLGLPSHLRHGEIDRLHRLDEDGLEEWAPWQDPLVSVSDFVKNPSKTVSTFNTIVDVMRSTCAAHTTGMTELESSGSVVLALLDNACRSEYRLQPSKLVIKLCLQSNTSSRFQPSLDAVADTGLSSHGSNYPPGDISTPSDFTQQQLENGLQSHQFLSIPHDPSDLAFLSGATTQPSGTSPHDTDRQTHATETAFANHDIFQELALLDSVNPDGQHPQFMQNLGFGPDLDLAEFFGPDYQPSDPLLAYMQPSIYGAAPPGSSRSGGDAG